MCMNLILLVRCLSLKEGALLLTGDFNEWRAARQKNNQIAPIVAAFSRASVPWPSRGCRPLWVPGGTKCPHPNAVGVAFLVAN